eukprot:g5346.t1
MAGVKDVNEAKQQISKASLEDRASGWSRLTLSWFTRLMNIARHKVLETEDIGQVSKIDESEINYERMMSLWEEEIAAKGKSEAKLINAWFRFVGLNNFILILLYATVAVIFEIFLPLISKGLLMHLEGSQVLNSQELILSITFLTIAPSAAGFVRGQMIMVARRKALQVYAALTTAVYRKTMKLSSAGKASVETGQIINMLSADAANAMEQSVFQIVPLIMGIPIMVAALVLLYFTIGVSMFAGFAFLVITIPVNLKIFRTVVHWYREAVTRADKRVKLVNELISGIRIVKFYAWEKPFKRMIEGVRGVELQAIEKHAYWIQCGMMVVFMQMPQLMQLCVFVTYYLTGHAFRASVIFTTMQLFNVLRGPVSQFPSALSQFASLVVATKRIGSFLKREETTEVLDDTSVVTECSVEPGESCVVIKNGQFAWRIEQSMDDALQQEDQRQKAKAESKTTPDLASTKVQNEKTITESEFKLSNVNVDIKLGELVMVVGSVGSGKSSLLMSVLNEMPKVEGSLLVKGKISLISQNAWITNSSLRENILFGETYNKKHYDQVVHVCGLEDDIANFDDGDKIIIGERGINLSGGQKTRVGLARAVYSDSDIVLLDCPLAAVDSHVGDHIFHKCILGHLSNRCRLFATNQTHRLHRADKIILLENGKVVAYGGYDELKSGNDKFKQLLNDNQEGKATHSDRRVESDKTNNDGIESANVEVEILGTRASKSDSITTPGRNSAKDIIVDEERNVGHVSGEVWNYFFKSAGYWQAAVSIAAISAFTYFQTFNTFVLAMWTNSVASRESSTEHKSEVANEEYNSSQSFYLGLYCVAVAVSIIFMFLGGSLMAKLRVKVAKRIHGDMLKSILRAPIDFFDITPAGRIMNRFSKEQNSVDMNLTTMIAWSFVIINFAIAAFLAIIISTHGYVLIVLIPLILLYYKVALYIRHTSIEVQRLEAIARSPLYAASTEILGGVETIRAFKQVQRFEQTYRKNLNTQLVPYFLAKTCVPVWMTMRINVLSSIIIGSISTFVVMMPSTLPAGFVGLAITFAMTITHTLMMCVNISVYAEIQMNAVERVKYYAEELPEEKPMLIENNELSTSWPSNGHIEIKDLVAGYRDGPDILKSISFSIKSREKIGIVGRTGSGKSTLLVTLFRIVEPRAGKITIDDIDISALGLEQLRSKLGIIPQDPVLFSGTLRHNLDPFESHSDSKLWEALEQVSLKSFVNGLPGKLVHKITEGGLNFSVGQRQLLCMARALLLDPKILLLDEATAQVDKKSDMLLQRMIRKCFIDKTVLTIAHRLDTIMDSDRILVLDQGNIAEFDTPKNLLQKKDGAFYSLVYAEGEKNAGRLVAMI